MMSEIEIKAFWEGIAVASTGKIKIADYSPDMNPKLQNKSIIPAASRQEVRADGDYYGLGTVEVSGDDNLISENIKQGVSIFGVEGNAKTDPVLEEGIILDPTQDESYRRPGEGYDGIGTVAVRWDPDLLPENILEDVEIYGVVGTLEQSVGTGNITDINFGTGYTAVITLDDGSVYTITDCDLDGDGKITRIYIEKDGVSKYLDCEYDAGGYLIAVGTVTVEDVYELGIADVKLNLYTGLNITPTKEAQTFEVPAGYDGYGAVKVKAIKLEEKGPIDIISEEQSIEVTSGYDGMTKVTVKPKLCTASVTPSTEEQIITPDSGCVGLSSVTIATDENLLPGNIKDGVQIFGITGTHQGSGGGEGALQIKEINPTAITTEYYPEYGYDAFSKVVVNGDDNLTADNIRNNVTIFGVTGNYESPLTSLEVTPTASPQDITQIPEGYFGFNEITVKGDVNLTPENIVKGIKIFDVTGTALITNYSAQEKTIVPTGEEIEVLPDEGYDGLSKVTIVNDDDLKPENIADGVTIYGVKGNHTGGSELLDLFFKDGNSILTTDSSVTHVNATYDDNGKIISVTAEDKAVDIEYDDNGYLTKIGDIDVRGIINLLFPDYEDGNTIKF